MELGIFYLPKSSNISETLANESDRNTLKTLQEFNCSVGLPLFLMLSSGPSETLLENRHFLRSNSIRSLQIENEKGPDRHPIFVNQMYNLVKPLAHPAGFEPTACRLGDEKSVRLGVPFKCLEALPLLGF